MLHIVVVVVTSWLLARVAVSPAAAAATSTLSTKRENKSAAQEDGMITVVGWGGVSSIMLSAFCDGTSRYGVPENLTTG